MWWCTGFKQPEIVYTIFILWIYFYLKTSIVQTKHKCVNFERIKMLLNSNPKMHICLTLYLGHAEMRYTLHIYKYAYIKLYRLFSIAYIDFFVFI